MRKYAGKCVALLMALLMLLTSMPLTALADSITSDAWSYTADPQPAEGGAANATGLPATAAAAVEAAQQLNTTNGQYVGIDKASISSATIKTGASVTYTIPYRVTAAPQYDPGTGQSLNAFEAYTNVQLTVTADENIVFDNGQNAITVNLGDFSATEPAMKTLSLTAHLMGNGTLPNNTQIDMLTVTITADVTVDGETHELSYTLNKNNNTAAVSKADNPWKVDKGAPIFVRNGETVTVTWTVTAGKEDGANLTGNAGAYKVYGVLNFDSFTLTDQLPQVNGKYPTNATITREGGGLGSYDPSTGKLTIGEYATITVDAAHGGPFETPYLSTYTVTATYPAADFKLAYGEGEANFKDVDNSVSISYTLVGETSPRTAEYTKEGAYGIPTCGGVITVHENIFIDKAYAYATPYTTLFEGPATFEVYQYNDKSELVKVDVALSVANENGASTPELAPGTYYVKQVKAPKNTDGLITDGEHDVYETINGDFYQKVVIPEGQETKSTHKLTFVNKVAQRGVLVVEKVAENGRPQEGVGFAVKQGDQVIDTFTTGENGKQTILLFKGEYTLVETNPLKGYAPMQPKSFTIEENGWVNFTGESKLVNYPNTGDLTITKKLTHAGSTTDPVDVSTVISDATFTFKLYQGKSNDPSSITTEYTTASPITIVANASTVTVENLPVADENGNPYYYKLVEEKGEDTRFTYDTDAEVFTFLKEGGAYASSHACDFVNELVKGKLSFTKKAQGLTGDPAPMEAEATFEVRKGSAAGDVVVESITTNADTGVATTGLLDIYDEKGELINYYIVETSTGAYTPAYPEGQSAWGPYTLDFDDVTTVSEPLINNLHQTKLTITKTDNTAEQAPIAGAKFTVRQKTEDGTGKYVQIVDGKAGLTENRTELETNDNGQIVLTGLPTGEYIVTEESVPTGYLATGTVQVGEDGAVSGAGAALTAEVDLSTPLSTQTVTFRNDKQPQLTLTKTVGGQGTTLTGFEFQLYTANVDAEGNPTGPNAAYGDPFANGQPMTVEAGWYYIVETATPAGAIAPAIVHTASDKDNNILVEDGKVYFGPYQAQNNGTTPVTVTIDNAANSGSLTINKTDAKTNTALAGATFNVSVSSPSEGVAAILTGLDFKAGTTEDSKNTYTLITEATGTNGAVTVPGLPVYDGETQISYTVTEAAAPDGYLLNEDYKDTCKLALDATTGNYTDTAKTCANAPAATATAAKFYYKEWDSLSNRDTYPTYPMSGASLAIFVKNEDGTLKQVGETLTTTDASNAVTFEGLDATKTYYIFEVGNDKGYTAKPDENKKVRKIVSAETIAGKNAETALAEYYGAKVEFTLTNGAYSGEVKLTNVEGFVQLTLNKYYYPEDDNGKDITTDAEGNDNRQPLNRAKFLLCRTTSESDDWLEDINPPKDFLENGTAWEGAAKALGEYLVSGYVYESGLLHKDGQVVTEALPATSPDNETYYYWLVEIEAPSGYAPLGWPDCVAGPFSKDNDTFSLENEKLNGGEGDIRYVQVDIDKVVRAEGSETGHSLANATFELYLVDGEGKRLKKLSTFTTGVDIPEGEEYEPGRAVSETFEMSRLMKERPNAVFYDEEAQEYTARFELVEVSWPSYTTPDTDYRRFFTITTNGDHDTMRGEDGENKDTMWAEFTKENKDPFVNIMSNQVVVTLSKRGYAGGVKGDWPLDGAKFELYHDANQNEKIDEGETKVGEAATVNGLVSFSVTPLEHYVWKEVSAPTGYQIMEETDAFQAPPYSAELETDLSGASMVIDEISNRQYTKVTITKEAGGTVQARDKVTFAFHNSDGVPVTIYRFNGNDAAGRPKLSASGTEIELTVGTATDIYLPTGTYTVVETKVNDSLTTPAQKSNFNLINDETFTIEDSTQSVTCTFTNPGEGAISLTKQDDAGKAMVGVTFNVYFKAFTSDDLAANADYPDAASIEDLPSAETGGENTVTSGEEGLISLTNLVPGWYRLEEVPSGNANANHVLAGDVVIKVVAGDDTLGEKPAENEEPTAIVNERQGWLTITKHYGSSYADATGLSATFQIYKDANCTEQPVGEPITLTDGATSAPVALDAGTYYIKETNASDSDSDSYVQAGVTYKAKVAGREDVETHWLVPVTAAVSVQIEPADTRETPAKVTFTNHRKTGSLRVEKVDDKGENVSGAKFVLYYTNANGSDVYLAHPDNAYPWTTFEDDAYRFASADGVAKVDNFTLPYDQVRKGEEAVYYVKEVFTPAAYTASEAASQGISIGNIPAGGVNEFLTGENAVVNEKGIVVTLTKYDLPYDHEDKANPLQGAQFTLYQLDANNAPVSAEVFAPKTAATNGSGNISFGNLPKLDAGAYAIAETATPDGFVEGKVEVYVGDQPAETVTATVDGQERTLYKVATSETAADVTVTAYNEPYGSIAVLKYDYVDKDRLPEGGNFIVQGTSMNTAVGTIDNLGLNDEKLEELNTLLQAQGYRNAGDHYEKDGQSYTIGWIVRVAPDTYIVEEEDPPNDYLGIGKSEPGDAWHTEQSVTVPRDGGVGVAVFANLPNPDYLPIGIDKEADYSGESLQSEGDHKITYTISNFADGVLMPLEKAQLTDDIFAFLDADGNKVPANHVQWSLADGSMITIGAVSYQSTLYAPTPATLADAPVVATVYGKLDDGWHEIDSADMRDGNAHSVTVNRAGYQGVRVVYDAPNADEDGLAAGFTAGEVTFVVEASQPTEPIQAQGQEPEDIRLVSRINNTAQIDLTYDFSEMSATSTSTTETATAFANAHVTVEKAEALPQAKIGKTSAVYSSSVAQKPEVSDSVVPGQVVEYTITAEGVTDGMENPILLDVVPNGLQILSATAKATNGCADLTFAEDVQINGQTVYLQTYGTLAQSDVITLTIRCTVLSTALREENLVMGNLVNEAYLFTETTLPKNSDNPNGVSFADEGGAPAGADLPAAAANLGYEGLKALKAEAQNPVSARSGLSISKQVSVDDETWHTSNSVPNVDAGGTIYYEVTVTNSDDTATITDLFIADTLPYEGDGSSAWGPTAINEATATLSGDGTATVYYSSAKEDDEFTFLDAVAPEDAAEANAIPEHWHQNLAEGDHSILVHVPVLEGGESVTLRYTCTAPTENISYYHLAVNVAAFQYPGAKGLASADTKVTILPAAVALGNEVWIDMNGDNVHDVVGETLKPAEETTFRWIEFMEGAGTGRGTTVTTENGIYTVSGLHPASPQDDDKAEYDDNDVDYTSLMGAARYTYQLQVTDLPEGYRVIKPYGGETNAPKVDDDGSTFEDRNSDSNFSQTATPTTEMFYLQSGTDDMTYDLGLMRMRDLTIRKVGTDGRHVEGATFAIYGHFYTDGAYSIEGRTPIATLTTGEDGSATFTSTADNYLDAYANYVVVETSAPAHYNASKITVEGVDETKIATATVTGLGEGQSCFILKASETENMAGAVEDEVNVTNDYIASGRLVINGNKTVNGLVPGETFTFALKDANGEEIDTPESGTNGAFTFTIDYDSYDDLRYEPEGGYVYTLSEKVPDPAEDGMVYDTTEYTITVQLKDNGAGKLIPEATVTGGEQVIESTGDGTLSGLDFDNRSQGALTVTKRVEGNDEADETRSYQITVNLTPPEGVQMGGQWIVYNGAGEEQDQPADAEAGGNTITLQGDWSVKFTGLPAGTVYEVTEQSYADLGFEPAVIAYVTDADTAHKVEQGVEDEVTVTNTRNVGSLTITKEVEGNNLPASDTFTFTVTLENNSLPVNKQYGDYTFAAETTEAGENPHRATATIALEALEDGDSVTLTGIPVGTAYTVVEGDRTADGYVTYVDTIKTDTASGTITLADVQKEAAFTNERYAGNVTISKVTAGEGVQEGEEFTFEIVFSNSLGMTLEGSYPATINGTDTDTTDTTVAVDASGKATFTLKGGESITIKNIPTTKDGTGTTYTVTEWMDVDGDGSKEALTEGILYANGYVMTTTGDAMNAGVKPDGTSEVTFTNTRDAGNLSVEKIVKGTGKDKDPEKEFEFSLTLSHPKGVNVDDEYQTSKGPLAVENGELTFKLKDGETLTIEDIPAGTHYTVTEGDYKAEGYVVEPARIQEGDIETDVTESLTFTNTRNIGGLTVTKVEEGNGFEEGYPNTQDAYDITVTLTPPAGVTLVGYVNGTALPADGTVTEGVWSKTLSLKAGESAVFTDLPEDTTYTISEADYTNLGYEEAQLTSTGTVTSGTTAGGLKYITGTIPGEEGANSVAVTVTNERNVGSLSVKKIVAGTGVEPEKDFTFTLQLTNNGVKLDGDYPATINTINGTATDDVEVDEDGTATFTLKGGETITIDGIPEGTTYKVTEAPYASEGYETKSDYKDATRTIGDGTTDEVTFTNTRNVGGFTLTKKTDGNGLDEPDVRTEFDITVTLTAPTGVQLVGTVDGKDLTEVAAIENGVWEHTFTLKNGEKVVFAELPEGTRYTIVEANDGYASEGFIDMLDDPGNGVITVAENAIEAPDVAVTLTNIRNVGGLTIVKKVTGSGSATNDTFTFRLELKNENGVNVNGEYYMLRTGESAELLPVANGEAVITLRGNQSAFIDGIPLGTKYTVTERATDLEGNNVDAQQGDAYANGFALTSENGLSGTITSEVGSYVAEFTNHRDVGSLTVTKNVEGNGEDAPNALTEFDVTVALTAPTGVTLTGTWTQGEKNGNVAASNTFTLTDGESVELTGLPAGTTYTITEESYAANGYESDIEPEEGEITDGATAVTVTNTMNVGDLRVTKTVNGTGAEADREFEFTLTLENADDVIVDNTYETSEGTLTVENGEATFTLKDGETLTVYGIPEGTDYTVTEDDYSANGYETTSTGDSSEIVAGETAKAEFTNHRDVGSLKITKNVEGNGEDAPNALTEFDVTVALTAPTGVTLTGTWTQGEKNGNVAASNTFTLKDGESVTLSGLPTGTAYTITEADYAENGYVSSIDPATGDITDGATAVTVTNTMNVGDLRVTKTVNGTGAEADREFEFTLTLENADDVIVDNTYETSEGTLTVENGEATFTLKDGETLTVYGIPEGTDYTVTEADPAGHGYLITAASGEEGAIGTGTSSASFTNTRDIGELSVEKTVEGAIGETDKAFAFTLKLIPSGNGIDVDGVYNATLYTADAAQSATATVANGVANFTLTHDQRLVIHEIPAGATYEVTEASYALEGYQTEASGERGTIPATGVMPVASFTNTRDAGNLRIEKVFAGNGPIAGDAFTFTIRLSRTDGVDVNGVYAALLNGEATQVAFTGGAATVALTGGDALEILDILSGTTYEVSEEIPDGSGYTGASENETGVIPVGATAATTFTNERNVGNLIVRKAVAGNAAETDRNFDFTIFLREPDGTNANGSYRMTGDAGSSITFVNGYASLSLAAGEEAVIQGILDGAYYDVREDDADTDGYVTTSSATAGLISAADDALVSFLNTRNVTAEVTSRTVYKVWNDENDADGLRPDELIVYLLADGDSVAAATLNEANGWSAVFDDLPVYNADGTQIGYEVVEAYTAEYYVRYQYTATAINITNTHNPDDFTPRTPDDPALLTLIEDNMVPLGGNINMNEGDCFN